MPNEMILDEVVCADLVPPAATMVLIVGQHLPGFEAQMAERKSKLLRIDWPFPAAVPAGVFDFVLLPPCDDSAVDELVTTALKLLDRHGALGLVTKVAVDNAEPPVALLKSATSHGLLVTRSRMCEEEGRTQWAFTLLRSDYDPVAHAADLERSGFPMRAFIVLGSISGLVDLSEESQATLAVERHRLLHDVLLQKAPDDSSATLFSWARKEFYLAVHTYPRLPLPYLRQAVLWRHFRRDDMAGRLLRSIRHVVDAPDALILLHDLDEGPGRIQEPEPAPLWSGTMRNPRVLIITHDNSDYGMDSLYDGLCMVISSDNVVEFPWKPSLHGERPETALNYPCVFDYPGEPRSEAQLEQELRNGRFDFILFADVVQCAYKDMVRRLLDAAGDIPVVVYDTWDDPHSLLPGALGYLGRPTISAYFKREMLTGFDYGENSFPLPFGYPDRLVPESVTWDRSQDLFWAGKRLFGTRALYLDWLAERLGRDMDRAYTQEEYRNAIGGTRIGLSLFGYGYDTVRYWELPAHGVMLLAERPPIRIPHNFLDGESAVFFDDLPELEKKLDYYLAHPEDAQVIAQAGREHFLRHHTTSMRAKQFLGRLEALIEW